MGPSQMGRFELLPPGAGVQHRHARLSSRIKAGKTLGSLLLGKKHMNKPAANSQSGGMGDEGWPDGRYVHDRRRRQNRGASISDPLGQSCNPSRSNG